MSWIIASHSTAKNSIMVMYVQATHVSAPLIPVGAATAAVEAATLLSGRVPDGGGGGGGGATDRSALPPQVHLLSLDREPLETTQGMAQDRVLLRVHHVFQEGESSQYSQSVTFDLAAFLAPLELENAVEMQLNAIGEPWAADLGSVTLAPLQIRTFEGTLTQKKAMY